MRILFISPTPPIPTTGSRTRLYNLVKQLAARHDVSLLSFIQTDDYEPLTMLESYLRAMEMVPLADFPSLGKWQNRLQGWKRIAFNSRPRYAQVFPTDSLRRPLRRLLATHQFDVAILQSLYVAELYDELAEIPTALATENVEAAIVRQRLASAQNGVHRLRDWLEWRKLSDYERNLVRRFKVCIAVSDLDVEMLSALAPQAEVHLVPNGVDAQAFLPSGCDRKSNEILFFGHLSYEPNANGLVWFCREFLPRIRSEVPNVKLVIAGRDAPERIKALGLLPGVELAGFVPDLRDKLWSSTLSIAPLRSGGGTRLKILESLAAMCPVVSTTVGAEGLDLVPNRDLLIADSAVDFATSVIRLLTDSDLRRSLAIQGRSTVTDRYDWQPISLQMEAACRRAAELHNRPNRHSAEPI